MTKPCDLYCIAGGGLSSWGGWQHRGENEMSELNSAYPSNSKEFAGIVYARVFFRSSGWSKDDVNAWLRESLPKFGSPSYGWSIGDAISLGDEFLAEASTW